MDGLTLVFSASADPTGRAILTRRSESDATVAQLAEPFEMSQPAVSKHLRVLETAGLISRSRAGTSRFSHLEAARLKEANEWMQRYKSYWNEGFDRLDAALADYLATEHKDETEKKEQSND